MTRPLFRVLTASMLMSAVGPVLSTAWASDVKIGLIEIKGKPMTRPSPLAWLFGDKDPTLRQIIAGIDHATRDSDMKGLVIRLKDAELSTADVQELGVALEAARAAGKKVHVLADAYETPQFMLGAYADEVIGQAGGAVSLPGLYMEEMFLADTLAWAGLKADYVQVGDFKGANEQMTRNKPSEAWNKNIDQLLDTLYANVRAPLLKGRKLTDAQLDEAMKKLWMADMEDAKKSGLIDTVLDLPALSDHLEKAYGGTLSWDDSLVDSGKSTPRDMSNPFALFSMFSQKPDHTPHQPTIALLHIDGAIIDGESGGGGIMGGEASVGSRTIRNAIEDIREQDLIKGVIVRIDSPGGSATASEVIWQGVRRLAEKKPVWVSVGEMAASGGYYIASAGDKIYVNPASIVGSIGVVGGKISMQGLYGFLKVGTVGRGRGPMSGMFASDKPWDEMQASAVRTKMTETFDLFKKRVADGRKGIDLEKTAGGWLFTGDKAIGLKMADKVGSLEVAIADLATKLNLNDYDVMDYPAPKPFDEVIEDALKGFAAAPSITGATPVRGQILGAIREVVGPRAWSQMEPSIVGYLQMRDQPVILMSPNVLIFR